MSKTVDERIVSMQFDNQHFEKNVQTTLSTLDKLKSALRLDGSAKAAKSEFESYSSGMFSMRDAINKAWASWERDLGIRIKNFAKEISTAFTTQPIKMGFSEYETQMGAIQTILSNTKSKGTTLDQVNSALDELNTYADKTIYNFTEMTRNIGTFTAAGVDLDTSVSAIKGIANLAAVSGSTSQQASTAMYQLSQAMASGTVKLMDWNSVVNAGMGGQVFQDALKETAKVHGVAIDDIIKKQGSFRESLSEGWLTTEILTETLSKFTGDLTADQLKSMGYTEEQIKQIQELGKDANDAATKVKTFSQLWDTLKEAAQSGWSQSFKILIGDFEEAKGLFTSLSDTFSEIIGRSAEARNELLENWKVLGGRDDVIESFKNVWKGFLSIIKPIKEAFREIFPPLTAEKLAGFTKGLKELTAKMELSHVTSNNLKRTFKGVFAVFSIVGKVLGTVAKAIGKVLGFTDDLGGGLLSVTAVLGDWLVGLHEAIDNSGILGSVFNIVSGAITLVASAAKSLFRILKESFVFTVISAAVESFITILGKAGNKMDTFAESGKKVADAWKNSGLYKVLSGIWNILKIIGSAIGKVFKGIFDGLANTFGSGDLKGGFEFINTILSGGLLTGLTLMVLKIKKYFSGDNPVTTFMDGIKNVLNSAAEGIENFTKRTSTVAENLKAIAVGIAVLAAALLVLSFVDPEKLSRALVALASGLGVMIGAIAIVSKLNAKDGNFLGVSKAIRSMTSLALSLVILSFAIEKIGGLDDGTFNKGLLGVTVLLLTMAVVISAINHFSKGADPKALKKAKKGAMGMAAALLVLAYSVEKLGNLTWDQWARGMLGIIGLLVVMTLVQKQLMTVSQNKNWGPKNIAATTKSYIALSVAILLLSSAVKNIGKLEWEQWARGIGGVIILLAALTGVMVAVTRFSKVSKNGSLKGMTSMFASMMLLSTALNMLIPILLTLALLPTDKMLKGVGGIVALLVALTAVPIVLSKFAGTGGQMLKAAGALAIMSFAINLLLPTLTALAILPLPMLLKAVIGLGVIFAELALLQIVMLRLGGPGGQLLKAAGSLAIMAVAISLLIPPLLAFALIPAVLIAKGLVVLTASLVVLAGVTLLIKPLVPTLLALSKALLTFGAATLLIGLGLVALGLGMTVLAAGLTALFGALYAIGGLASTIGSALITIISSMIEGALLGLGKGIVALGQLLLDSFDVIRDVLIGLVKMVCEVLIECVPQIVETVLIIVHELLVALVDFAPKIVSAAMELFSKVIVAIAEKLPELGKALAELLLGLVEAMLQGLGTMDTSFLLKALTNIGLIAAIMAALAAMKFMAPAAMVGILAMAAVVTELGLVLAAIGALAQIPGLTWLVNEGGKFLQAVGTAIGSFVGGLVGGIAKGITSVLPQIGKDLAGFANNAKPFFDLAPNIDSSMLGGIKTLANIILQLTATNLLDGINRLFGGEASLPKFGKELADFSKHFKTYADNVAGIDASAVKTSADAAKALTSVVNNLPRTGGLAGLFAGNKDLGDFASQLSTLGKGMKKYADSVAGIDPEAVIASAEAAKALASITNALPNEGGVEQWFTGSKSIANFGNELKSLGDGLKGFSDSVTGIDADSMTSAANAGKAIAEITKNIPNEGGMGAWFSGEKSISKFGNELVTLGKGLAGFAQQTSGINVESTNAAAGAAKALADMTNAIPNEGGVASWFAGDKSISKFGNDLIQLGKGLKGFAQETSGINPETTEAGANAAKSIAEMTKHIPEEGGIGAWFTGEKSISKFGADLVQLGTGLKGFSTELEGINPENITAAATSAKSLAEMTKYIPEEGGISSWFSGDKSISSFAGKLPSLGKGLKGFSDSLNGINPQNISLGADAAKAVAQMAGENLKNADKIPKFGTNLEKLGTSVKSCFENFAGISEESISATTKALDVVTNINNTDVTNVGSIATSINDVTKAIKDLASVPGDATSGFSSALKTMGETSADSLLKPFKDIQDDMEAAGKAAIDAFVRGVNGDGKTSAAETACDAIVKACESTMKDGKDDFYSAGNSLVEGFANGISANQYKAVAQARAMAVAAYNAAKEALDVNSPSKLFRSLGYSVPEGFAVGIDKLSGMATDSATTMATDSVDNVKTAISRIADAINTDIDAQPTIRPVLDLSDIHNNASSINNLLNRRVPVGVMANVGSINKSMSGYSQNGETLHLASEIDKLSKTVANMEHVTYTINGINYTEGSDVEEAIKTILRAAQIERRS